MAGKRAALHQLVDDLPENDVPVARRFLQYLRAVDRDPVLRALAEAAETDEPPNDGDRKALAEARRDEAAGRVVSHAEARRRLLGAA